MLWIGPKDENEADEETGFEIGENIGRSDSPDDVHDDRLMDARPTGITLEEEDETEQ